MIPVTCRHEMLKKQEPKRRRILNPEECAAEALVMLLYKFIIIQQARCRNLIRTGDDLFVQSIE